MTSFRDFLKKNYYPIIVTILLLVFCTINFVQYQGSLTLAKKLAVSEHNLAVTQDTLRTSVTKSGQREANILAYWTDKNSNLAKLNARLSKEIDSTKGVVNTIIAANVELKNKPAELIVRTDTVYGPNADSSIKSSFSFEKTYSPGNYRKIKGFTNYDLKTKVSSGTLEEDQIGMSFVTGIKNVDKGKPEIFLRSNYPGFEVDKLEGAVLDPKLFEPKKTKPKLVTMGLNVGWTPVVYNIATKKFTAGLSQVGVTAGVSFNIGRMIK